MKLGSHFFISVSPFRVAYKLPEQAFELALVKLLVLLLEPGGQYHHATLNLLLPSRGIGTIRWTIVGISEA